MTGLPPRYQELAKSIHDRISGTDVDSLVHSEKFAVKISDLTKTYGNRLILDDLYLKIRSAKKTTIIGPSGCGKSTLLRLILGLEGFDEGSMIIDGENTADYNEEDWNKIRHKFGMVFQSAALFDSLTVGENVALILTEHQHFSAATIKKLVLEKLDMVGLADTYSQYPSKLSGGMKKRVAFARAIVNNPKILLFDEPTTGLDPITSTTIENLINSLTASLNATTIVVTHQISTILNTSEKIIMIHDGQAVKTEGPDKIMQSKDKRVYSFVNGLVSL